MRRSLFLLLVFFSLILVGCGSDYEVSDVNLIPVPVSHEKGNGSVVLSSDTKISFENMGQNTPTAKYVSRSLRKMHFVPTFMGEELEFGIVLRINDSIDESLGQEGYSLVVSPSSGVSISANTDKGLFYGYQTFLQMLPSDITTKDYSSVTIPACTIVDTPRFDWRACRIDLTSHFFSVDDVKKVLDLMAAYKFNKLVVNIADDYGCRFESSLFPSLASVGAWRPERKSEWAKCDTPRKGESCDYGGYYSKDEIHDLVQYAASMHIELIPEISLPTHCAALLASCPQFACRGKEYAVQCGPNETNAVICLGNDSTVVNVLRLVDEVCSLFPGQYIHIGGDTVAHGSWTTCPRCRYRMIENSVRTERQLQTLFVNQVVSHLADENRKVLVWDDLFSSDLDTDVVVVARSSHASGLAASKHGNKVVVAPSGFCAFERYQSDPDYHPVSDSGIVDLQRVYAFDPAPVGTNTHLLPYIMGGMCGLTTSHVTNLSQMEFMLLPRLCAMSEALWSARSVKDWKTFRTRVESHKSRLKEKGFVTSSGSFRPVVTCTPTSQGQFNVSFETEVMNTYVYYTTDGTVPTPSSQAYVAPILLKEGTIVKTISIYDGKQRDGVYEFIVH